MGFKLRKILADMIDPVHIGEQLAFHTHHPIIEVPPEQTVNVSLGVEVEEIGDNDVFEIFPSEDLIQEGLISTPKHFTKSNKGSELVVAIKNISKGIKKIYKGFHVVKGILKVLSKDIPEILPFVGDTMNLNTIESNYIKSQQCTFGLKTVKKHKKDCETITI